MLIGLLLCENIGVTYSVRTSVRSLRVQKVVCRVPIIILSPKKNVNKTVIGRLPLALPCWCLTFFYRKSRVRIDVQVFVCFLPTPTWWLSSPNVTPLVCVPRILNDVRTPLGLGNELPCGHKYFSIGDMILVRLLGSLLAITATFSLFVTFLDMTCKSRKPHVTWCMNSDYSSTVYSHRY